MEISLTRFFEEDLVLEEDTVFEEGIEVNGNISGKNGKKYNLIVGGDISAWAISVRDIFAWDISAINISAEKIDYYAFCIAYENIKCREIRGRRENCFHKALDGKIEIGADEEKSVEERIAELEKKVKELEK